MSRAQVDYSAPRAWSRNSTSGAGIDVSTPAAGYFRHKLRSGAVAVGVRIFFGPPCEPWTGEEMDRSHRWQAHCNGKYIEIDRVWPGCAGQPIDAAEYDHLTSLQRWGEQHSPTSPEANPHKAVNWLTAPLTI